MRMNRGKRPPCNSTVSLAQFFFFTFIRSFSTAWLFFFFHSKAAKYKVDDANLFFGVFQPIPEPRSVMFFENCIVPQSFTFIVKQQFKDLRLL